MQVSICVCVCIESERGCVCVCVNGCEKGDHFIHSASCF